MNNIIKLIVEDNQEDVRIDYFISKKYKYLSRTKIKSLILKNKLRVNENIVKDPSRKVNKNDNIILEIEEEKKLSLKPFDYKLNIIFEDDDLIVLNKNAGISIHPGAGNYDNTIVNALINYNGKNLSNINENFRPGIVHRIDKDTSGLIVVAKNNFSHINLSAQFKKHLIDRVYLAMVWGKLRPSSGKIENYIKRSKKNRQLMEVSNSKGKRAITNYKTLEVFENDNTPTFSLVECKLETGRTHQIRVHFAEIDHPLWGDRMYGKSSSTKSKTKLTKDVLDLQKLSKRQALHAWKVQFKHPVTEEMMKFEAPIPKDLQKFIDKLRESC